MSFKLIRRQLLALTALVMAGGVAQGATVYQLDSMSFFTTSGGGITLPFGTGAMINSVCISCGTSLVTDDGAGNLTVGQVSYLINGFGVNFTDTFSGTATLGTGTSLLKQGETCTVHSGGTHICNPADQRSFAGDWLTGVLADGTTAAPTHNFNAVVSGNNLTMRFTTNRDATPFNDADALALIMNYSVVPVPAAVWLFGSAVGLLGIARRRSAAKA